MAIAVSHGGSTSYSTLSRSTQVLVGTVQGIFSIERDAPQTWRVADHALTDSHVSSIIFEPESGLIFAGAFFNGGVHVSADDGKTWERCDSGIAHRDVYSLAAVKRDGKVRLYAGTEPAHLFYSDDLGRSWTELPSFRSVPGVDEWTFPAPPHAAHVKHINFHPDDPFTLLVSVEQGGLLKSTDAGRTWEDLHVPYADVHRTVINPQDPNRIYVTGGDGLYASLDGGMTWEHWTFHDDDVGDYPDLLVLHPQRPQLMFMAAAHHVPLIWRETHSAGARISRSSDGGRSWEVLTGGLPERLQGSVEAMALEDWGESFSLFAATTSGEVWNSEDGGDTWSVIISGLAPISKKNHYRPLVASPA